MSWAQAVSEVKPELLRWAVNYFGLAIVLGVCSWLLWGEYQDQVDARFASIEREPIEAEEQKQRAELFSAIERHLDNISQSN
jgi:F0F1-type ATP synthase membrane subunit b/b'